MPRTVTLAFAHGAPLRAVGALLFAAAVALAAWLVESGSPAPVPNVAVVANGTACEVEVDATYAVAVWAVTVDGRAVAATRSDPRRWSGALPGGRELDIEAPPADPLAGGAAALRLHLRRGGAERIIDAWGDGAAALRIDLTAGP